MRTRIIGLLHPPPPPEGLRLVERNADGVELGLVREIGVVEGCELAWVSTDETAGFISYFSIVKSGKRRSAS